MKAARIHEFGPPSVIVHEEVPRPEPGRGEVLVRVLAAGVGPWDAWVRAGKSAISQPLPLTLGSDLSGVVDSVGPEVLALGRGDHASGVTNKRFTESNTEYAVASAAMLPPKPPSLDSIRATSVPVVAVTDWRALFDYAQLAEGQHVLIHNAAGNVGAYAVQLARWAGIHVHAAASRSGIDFVRSLGADSVTESRSGRFETAARGLDAVIDTVGGEMLDQSYGLLKPNGILLSIVAQPDDASARS